MILRRRSRPADSGSPEPVKPVCADGQPGRVIGRDGDWTTVEHQDGATRTVLASRVTPCTCGGGGCK